MICRPAQFKAVLAYTFEASLGPNAPVRSLFNYSQIKPKTFASLDGCTSCRGFVGSLDG